MTAITTNVSDGIVLSSPAYTNPIAIGSGVTVAGTASGGDAIAAYTGPWTIANAGLVTGTAIGGKSIYLSAGGAITNQAGGTIAGAGVGIAVSGSAATVINAGSVGSGGSDDSQGER
jgi:fibronectin-binding autotransporter adhesin